MKFFAFFVLMMMVAVQAFALPAAPAPAQPQGEVEAEPSAAGLPSGAPKAKRALYYYTPLVPTVKYFYPTYYYYHPYDIIV